MRTLSLSLATTAHCTHHRTDWLALVGLRSKRNAEDAGEEKCNKWRAGSTIVGEAWGRRGAGRRRHSMQSTAYRRLQIQTPSPTS